MSAPPRDRAAAAQPRTRRAVAEPPPGRSRPPDPYAALLEHAELELELAGRGELEELSALGPRWEELTRELPARPPAAAASLLERALLIHERTRIELIRLREALLADLASAGRAKRAADGYGAQLPRRRPHLDRSA